MATSATNWKSVGFKYPKGSLDMIAGNTHVRTPANQIKDEIVRRVGKLKKGDKSKWTDHKISRSASYIKALHGRHIKDMKKVNIHL